VIHLQALPSERQFYVVLDRAGGQFYKKETFSRFLLWAFPLPFCLQVRTDRSTNLNMALLTAFSMLDTLPTHPSLGDLMSNESNSSSATITPPPPLSFVGYSSTELEAETPSRPILASSDMFQEDVFSNSTSHTTTGPIELPISPEVTPSPSKRRTDPIQQSQSPTKQGNASIMVTPAFQFGLPSAQTVRDVPDYSFGIPSSGGEKSSGASFARRTSKTPILDQEKHLSDSKKAHAHMPSRRTVKKYIVVVIFCFALFLLSRLTGENFMGLPKSPRRFNRYIPSSLTRENLVAEHHDPEAYERFAEITAKAETETHGSDWAWKPTTSAHSGLYILDDEDEEDDEADFARLRSNEEYQAVKEEVSQANAFSSLLSVDQQRHRGRSEERLNGLSPAEIVALTQLEEKNRIASLRALVAFIDSGAILPEDWEEEGIESPLAKAVDAAWADEAGTGMESALSKVLGKRLGAKIFHRSWEQKIDNAKKLVIFSRVSLAAINRDSAMPKLTIVLRCSQSYCPYSRHVRRLLDDFKIVPAPAYIQIDQRVDGPIILSLLQEFTSRETIPSVLLNWQPIGGAAEIELASAEGSLSRIFAREGLRIAKKF
jgi:hypothetical protein